MIDSEFIHQLQHLSAQGPEGMKAMRQVIADNGGFSRLLALAAVGLQRTAKKKAQQPSLPGMEFPDWWPAAAWAGYVEMRKAKGVPVTPSITALLVKKISALKDQGQNPVLVLEQATIKCWTDLYAVHHDFQPSLRVVGGTEVRGGGNWDVNDEG